MGSTVSEPKNQKTKPPPLWFFGFLVSCFFGFLVLFFWFFGFLVFWFFGFGFLVFLVSWFFGFLVLVFWFFGFLRDGTTTIAANPSQAQNLSWKL